jgi:hypothetical protein
VAPLHGCWLIHSIGLHSGLARMVHTQSDVRPAPGAHAMLRTRSVMAAKRVLPCMTRCAARCVCRVQDVMLAAATLM